MGALALGPLGLRALGEDQSITTHPKRHLALSLDFALLDI